MKRRVLLVLIGLFAAFGMIACGPIEDSTPTQKPTIKPDGSTQKPAPTGCKGKIVSRVHDPASKTFAITYNDAKCQPSRMDVITEDQDLNARCWEGEYFPQCLKWYETEPPGIRMPTGDPGEPGQ